MSLADLGGLAEILGAIGVIISLLYLSRQVSQNTDALRSGDATTVQGNFQQLARLFYTDREMGAVLLKAMAGDELEDPADRQAVFAYYFDMLKTAEISHLQYLKGELDAELWEASARLYRAYFSTAGYRSYWEERQAAFTPIFRRTMSEWLEEPEPIKKPTVLTGQEAGAAGAP